MNVIDFANDILELKADRDYYQREAAHYKHLYEQWAGVAEDNLRNNQEMLGNILLASLDENSGLNKMFRAVDRDPMRGAK